MSGYCNYIRKAACLRFQRSMLLSNILERGEERLYFKEPIKIGA